MQIPFVKYIEALVVGKLSDAHIQQKLGEISLKFPDKGIQIVREKFSKERPDYFYGKEEIELTWLENWDIEKMYGHLFNMEVPPGTHGITGAFEVLNDPLMYRLITSMALAGITKEDIELIVNGKYNIHYSSEDIEEFLKYFFNVEKWTLSDKKEYVTQIADQSLQRFYTLALKGDKDYLLWKLGAAPDKSFNLMLRDMMVDSYYNFKERSKVDPDTAQRWGGLAVKLTDRLEKLEKDTDNKQDLFEAIQFQIETLVVNTDSGTNKKRSLANDTDKIKHISEVNQYD